MDSIRTRIDLLSRRVDVRLRSNHHGVLQTVRSVDAFRKSLLGHFIQQLDRYYRKFVVFAFGRDRLVRWLVGCLSTSNGPQQRHSSADRSIRQCLDTVECNINDFSKYEEGDDDQWWNDERIGWQETRLKSPVVFIVVAPMQIQISSSQLSFF